MFLSVAAFIPIPYSELMDCRAKQVMYEQSRRVQPITSFPDEAIISESQSLIQKQLQAVKPNGVIREQVGYMLHMYSRGINYTLHGLLG